jgi:group I intron endonuclease
MRVDHKDYIVYKSTNIVNGNFYIGATSTGIDNRRKSHLVDARSGKGGCKVFHRAVQKYGEQSFSWEIIAVLETFSDMMLKEIELIAELKPQYNMTKGGEGVVGLERTKEWRDKVSKALKGRKLSLEQVEALRKMDKSFQYKSIICLNDNKFFESVKAAKQHYNIADVSGIFRGEQKAVSGLYFEFSDKPYSDEECSEKFLEKSTACFEAIASRTKKNWRAVICLNDAKQYDRVSQAARAYDLAPIQVVNSCKEGTIVKKNLRFVYLEDYKVAA